MTDLHAALENEHCWGECGNACDIHAAWDAGYDLWAARLLMGATECPETTAAFVARNPTDAEVDAERDAFIESVPHLACRHCGAWCWNSPPDYACDNCNASLAQVRPAFRDPDGDLWCNACLLDDRFTDTPNFDQDRKMAWTDFVPARTNAEYRCFCCNTTYCDSEEP